MSNTKLIPFRVSLNEDAGDKFKLMFDCEAQDADDAAEQAEKAYPGCVVISCSQFDELVFNQVIFSPSEMAAGNGFWSNTEGWVELPQATRFTVEEIETLNLPKFKGQDARWMSLEEANVIFVREIQRDQMENLIPCSETFARSGAIKAEYLNSGCQASDVDDAIRKLMAECGELFADDRAAWEFLMEEPHEENELTAFQNEVAVTINRMLQEASSGQTIVFLREAGQLVPQVINSDAIDLKNLDHYEMIVFEGGTNESGTWKHVFFPKLGQHHFVNENPLLAKKDAVSIGYSVDGGITWNAAREGVRIAYSNVIVDGEDRRGELLINATHEGLISDIWVRRGDPQVESDGYDHNIGSGSESIDDIVTRLIAEND